MMDHSAFIHAILEHIEYNLLRFPKCLNLISENELWLKPNNTTNSIGNLMLHLQGNMTQYVLSGLGGQPDNRKRDDEFMPHGNLTKSDVLESMSACISDCTGVISGVTPEQLNRVYTIQGFRKTGFSVLVHVTEHLSYHVGQIAVQTKLMANKDLGFYDGLDLNITT